MKGRRSWPIADAARAASYPNARADRDVSIADVGGLVPSGRLFRNPCLLAAEPACFKPQRIAHDGQPRVLSESESQREIVAVAGSPARPRRSQLVWAGHVGSPVRDLSFTKTCVAEPLPAPASDIGSRRQAKSHTAVVDRHHFD
jgi:hypothetical protein